MKYFQPSGYKRFTLFRFAIPPSALRRSVMAGAAARKVEDHIKRDVDKHLFGDGGKLSRWNAIKDILTANHLCYKRKVQIGECMVHRLNRGGLGLNAYNAHKTLAVIKAVGCDTEHLKKATAFELPTDHAELRMHLDCNKSLIQSADGMLAPLTGEERLLTVACSHTVAGFRAAKAMCRSPQPALQDENGKINMLSLTADDPTLRDVIDNGFEFTIIPAWVADNFGAELPDLAQSALNAEQAAYNNASELQVMSTIAIHAAASETPDKCKVIEQVAQSQPPSLNYLSSLYDFVQLFGGGPGAPMIKYSGTRYDRVYFYTTSYMDACVI